MLCGKAHSSSRQAIYGSGSMRQETTSQQTRKHRMVRKQSQDRNAQRPIFLQVELTSQNNPANWRSSIQMYEWTYVDILHSNRSRAYEFQGWEWDQFKP